VGAWLLVGLGACGGGNEPDAPASASGCPQLDPEEPVTLDADVRVVATGLIPTPQVSPLAAVLSTDGGDVYWFDGSGSVFVERDEARVVELMRSDAPESETREYVVRGIAASADRLYVGDGFLQSGLDYFSVDFDPPGRLFSISRQDGRAEVLLELSDRTVAPIAADSERVIVFADGADRGYYQVRLADPRLERLPLAAPYQSSQLVGDKVYWLNNDHPPRLLRSGFDDAEPESVMRMYEDDYFVAVGTDHVLSLETRILPGYFSVGKDFVLSDDSGCRAFPGPRSNGLFDLALDAKYAYWYGGRQPPELTLSPTDFELFRLDVESGASTRLNTPGFTPEADIRIVGQDATRVFLRSNGTLVAVQKP